jgi:signal transduction histidine kinase
LPSGWFSTAVTFFFITVKDLWIYRPPLTSDLWLQFFTVVMVVYFLIDCSLGFLRLYRKNLDHIANLKVEHERTKAALVVKSQFVSVVSHELRTPLTSIKGSLDLINSGRSGRSIRRSAPSRHGEQEQPQAGAS